MKDLGISSLLRYLMRSSILLFLIVIMEIPSVQFLAAFGPLAIFQSIIIYKSSSIALYAGLSAPSTSSR